MGVKELLYEQLGPNQVINYVYAILAFLIILLVLRFVKFILIKRLAKLAKRTKTTFDDSLIEAIDNIGWLFYLITAFFVSARLVILPVLVDRIIQWVWLILLLYYAVRFTQRLITYTAGHTLEKKGEKADVHAVKFISTFAKISLWVIAGILFLDNIGVDIGPLIAGLGIGGIAIAFALQGVLSDLFASISIALDKPFKVGDFVVLGADMGVIEKIGLKTTRIRTLQGQELVVSNQELTSTRINNYKKMQKRRIVFQIGVIYGTSHAKLQKIPKIVKDIFKKVKLAELDRVHFKSFGDFSLNYEIVYYVDTGDYNQYMDVQQKINLDLVKAFQKEKIEFAYPTQTIFLEK